jgi:tRNA threonylcarbamoyladenosine biosynthesis protein TsaB
MRVLAIDTSTNVCSVCIADGEQIVAEYVTVSDKTHTERLMPAIEMLFSHLNSNIQSIEGLTVIHGPGSFTGLRISLSVVKGLAFALKVPIVAASALEIAALQISGDGLICPALDARRHEIFTCLYKKVGSDLVLLEEPRSISPGDWIKIIHDAPITFCGPGAHLYWKTLRNHADSILISPPDLILAKTLALYAGPKLQNGEGILAQDLKAAYLRPSDAETKSGRRA